MPRETQGYIPAGESNQDLPFEMENDELTPDVLTPENVAKISDAAENLQRGQAVEVARQKAEAAAIENEVEGAFDKIKDEEITELDEAELENEDIEQAS